MVATGHDHDAKIWQIERGRPMSDEAKPDEAAGAANAVAPDSKLPALQARVQAEQIAASHRARADQQKAQADTIPSRSRPSSTPRWRYSTRI
jgi:hypothetical protein